MADLQFEVNIKWSGTGKDGEGQIDLGDETLRYSAPADMGGKGVGASPEDLLISAVCSCYSGTLFGVLRRTGLPARHIDVWAEGFVTGYPRESKFSRLLVHPTINGGDATRQAEYEKAATAARDRCFIGKTIAGNVAYEVGTVQIVPEI